MKNKNFTRFLCFFVCFCLCFTWFGPPMEANAVALELGYMTWILISAMTAMGFTFAATGGIQALQNAVEEAVDDFDEYQKTIGHNRGLFESLDDKLLFGGGGGQGPNLGNKFWLGAAAVAAIGEFIQWVRENKWGVDQSNESSIENSFGYYRIGSTSSEPYTYLLGNFSLVDGNYLSSRPFTSFPKDSFLSVNQNIYFQNSNSSYGDAYFNIQPSTNYFMFNYVDNNPTVTGGNHSTYNYFAIGYVTSPAGYYVLESVDNVQWELAAKWQKGGPYNYKQNETAIITSPTEVTEFDVQEGQALELDFSIFENEAQFQSPEELADAIKNNIVDTGTVPEVSPSVVPDPSSNTDTEPDPAPTPDVETDGTLEGNVSGILEWIKAIYEAIVSLPRNIANLILDGIKSIFVPDPDEINAQFMELLEEINDKYLFDFDLDSLFGSSKEPDDITAVYSLGDHEWSLTFVSWYYLKKAVEFFRPYIRGFIVLMLIFYNLRQFMAIFGLGGVMNGDSADRRVEDLAV